MTTPELRGKKQVSPRELPTQLFDWFWIGPETAIVDHNGVKEYNFTHLLNCSDDGGAEYKNKLPNGVLYKGYNISDMESEPIEKHFEKVFNLIEWVRQEREQKRPVRMYMYCGTGISLSVTFACYWFMKFYKKPLDDCLEFVKKRRPYANPNFGFLKKLRIQESTLLGYRKQQDIQLPHQDYNF